MPCLTGGADTTVSTEYAFYLAMVLFPDVQKKAQAEIDAVVGSGRLPTFADQLHLPYVNAIVTEVLRWNSVGPLGMSSNICMTFEYFIIHVGVPHTASQDGYINGYFIPKGSMVVTNLW